MTNFISKYNDNLYSGEIIENYENGLISKIMEVEKGTVLNHTHFNESGDSIATMSYYEDGSFKKYVDKTIKNNIIDFECIESNDGLCSGSKNLPVAGYRLARIIDYWIEENGLLEDYKQTPSYNRTVLTKPTGSASIGSLLGKSTMLFSGSSISSVVDYDSENFEDLEGPFYADNILTTIEYKLPPNWTTEYFNENAKLKWFTFDPEKSIYNSEDKLQLLMRAMYRPVEGGSSAGTMLYVYFMAGESMDDNSILISIQGSNNKFVYQAKLEGISYSVLDNLVLGKDIFNQPGYNYKNFNLYWHNEKSQNSEKIPSGEKSQNSEKIPKYIYTEDEEVKIYEETIVLIDYSIQGSKNKIISDVSGYDYYLSSSYTNNTSLVGIDSVFEEFIKLQKENSIFNLDLQTLEFEGEYEIRYIERNWVENDEFPDQPIMGQFIFSIKKL